MEPDNRPGRRFSGLPRKYGALALVWSVLVIGSLLWDMQQSSTHALNIAAAAARADIGKDLIFRRWATSHGGVYVVPTEHTPPNPYLKVPDRDVTTTSGKRLTLMNPAYMLREMQTDFPNEYGTRSHITSLKLLNPGNAPDEWEASALRAFEQGEKERVETEQVNGQPYLRMMRPLVAEKGCLKCHGFQGYKEGDIRGGLSIMIPLIPFLASEREGMAAQALSHGAIWLIGLVGLGFSYRRERRQFGEYEKAEEQLRTSSLYTRSLIEASLDPLVTISTEGKITDVNEATEKVTGRDRAELIGTDFSDYFTEPDKARTGYQQVFREGSVTDYPLAIRHRDGYVTDVLYNASVYRDESGKMLGVFAAARDVTERKRIEDALRSSESRYRALVESAPMCIHEIGMDGRITSMNKAGLMMMGVEEECKVQGFPYLDAVCDADRARIGDLLARAYAGESSDFEFKASGPDGPIFKSCFVPIKNQVGKVEKLMGITEDITEHKHAEAEVREKEERLALATLKNGVGVWDWNLKTQEMIWDDSMFALYHIRREDFIGTEEAWRAALHPEDLNRGDQEVADAIAGIKPFETDFRVVWPGGEIRHIKAVAKVFRDEDGTPSRMLGINMDITELKRAGEEIHQLNAELEQRVVERTAQLEAANKELEAFSYSVSHDLRAPLRAIDGFSRILQDEYGEKFDAEGKHLLDVVRDNAARMGQLIDDILQFSRSGRTELNFSSIDMGALAHEVLGELLHNSPDSRLQVEIGQIPQASGDRAMLRQVFVNLLSNAVKFSHKNDAPRVEVGGGIENGEAVYYVKDNGAGFDMRYADHLFGVFQRLHSMNEFEGTGIGLAIVKRIVTRHGGRVWAEGKVGEGATIYFALPVQQPGKA